MQNEDSINILNVTMEQDSNNGFNTQQQQLTWLLWFMQKINDKIWNWLFTFWFVFSKLLIIGLIWALYLVFQNPVNNVITWDNTPEQIECNVSTGDIMTWDVLSWDVLSGDILSWDILSGDSLSWNLLTLTNEELIASMNEVESKMKTFTTTWELFTYAQSEFNKVTEQISSNKYDSESVKKLNILIDRLKRTYFSVNDQLKLWKLSQTWSNIKNTTWTNISGSTLNINKTWTNITGSNNTWTVINTWNVNSGSNQTTWTWTSWDNLPNLFN